MAKPIQLDIPARDHKLELQQRLAEAPADHAAAILDLLELLDVLHERNVLSTVRGAVGASDSIVNTLANAAAHPDSVRAMRNLLAITKILSSIDPELIEAVQKSIPAQFKDRNQRQDSPPPSLWKIIRTFWSAPVQRALFAWGLMLSGVGYYMAREQPRPVDQV